jgi:hypothetical protein
MGRGCGIPREEKIGKAIIKKRHTAQKTKASF